MKDLVCKATRGVLNDHTACNPSGKGAASLWFSALWKDVTCPRCLEVKERSDGDKATQA